MTKAVSVEDIVAQQAKLQANYEKAQGAMQDAQGKYKEEKAALCTFNDKYGRVIAMMNED